MSPVLRLVVEQLLLATVPWKTKLLQLRATPCMRAGGLAPHWGSGRLSVLGVKKRPSLEARGLSKRD